MIEVVFNRGLYLPEMDFWLDPQDVKECAFVSHAHADHFSRHARAICSDATAGLLRARFNMADARLEAHGFGEIIERGDFRMRMLPAGHIVGSAMLHVTRKKDGATLLYTGDFKVKRGRTTDAVNFIHADTLIMETTFGLPHLVFPGPMEVDAAVLRFVNDALADGDTPVLFAYSLGKAQEVVALLAEHEIPLLSHPKVAEMTAACRAVGVDLPEPVIFEGCAGEGQVVVCPPNTAGAKVLKGLKRARTAMLSGWALQPGASYRYRVDEIIPMSDHADHTGLHECVTRVRPKHVITVHGYTKEFAAELRMKGIDAWSAMGGDQLDLPLGKFHTSAVGVANLRHTRPICQLADFSDLCRLVGETSSRVSKVGYLANYLRSLSVADDLRIVTRWLVGKVLEDEGNRAAKGIQNDKIKRSLVMIPGVRSERVQEVFAAQKDITRVAKILLQEIPIIPKQLTISEIAEFFHDYKKLDGTLDQMELLSKRLHELHPTEGELMIKLLTGGLGIGLREEEILESIREAFKTEDEQLRAAYARTGDLGEAAVMAMQRQLAEGA